MRSVQMRLLIILALAFIWEQGLLAQQFTNPRKVIGNGGGRLTNSNNILLSTVGEEAIGDLSNANNIMKVGFWQVIRHLPNTQIGTNVVVQPVDSTAGTTPVTVTFDSVSQAGNTTLVTSSMGPPPPSGFSLGTPPTYFDIATTTEYEDSIEVCIDYSGISVNNENNLKLFHRENNAWVDRTSSHDPLNDIICAKVTSFSLFAIFELENRLPVITVAEDTVTFDEGQIAQNSGTVSDADDDSVSLDVSVGSIESSSGTWSWNFATMDGPAESQEVTITASDCTGISTASFQLNINNVAPSVDKIFIPVAPVAIADQPISVSAIFSDPAGANDQPFSCTVDYGDTTGQLAGTVSDSTCTGPDHTFASAGVYTVTVTVTDKDSSSGSAQATDFIVIYDPSAGFVTGGGWIDSPPGAYAPDAALVGKANFGFVSKYKQGQSVPDGNTKFQFKVADLKFASTSYDWLVIAGPNAKYKGSGSINGAGDFGFMLTARDGEAPGGGGIDRFRLKIWQKDSAETVVYDNQMGDDDNTDATDAIEGGSIVIHSTAQSKVAGDFAALPTTYALQQNYPNPFNPETTIRFQLPEPGHVTLNIFNFLGQKIRTLVDVPYEAGYHKAVWDGKDERAIPVASGIYIYRLRVNDFIQVRKMIVLR